ncbi:MAG: hypothetical protein AAGC55_22945 [Myxococcota bacterium]
MTHYLSPLIIAVALLATACETTAPEYRYGFNVTGLTYEVVDETEGIYPSEVVLINELNPFRDVSISNDTGFELLGRGGNAGAFYAWATLLAREPTGERQFYAAAQLSNIYQDSEVPEDDLETVRLMAIAGFQVVLDEFPTSVTFDATGTIPFNLATPSFLGIEELGGRVEGGWVLVGTPGGGQQAVLQSGEGSN